MTPASALQISASGTALVGASSLSATQAWLAVPVPGCMAPLKGRLLC